MYRFAYFNIINKEYDNIKRDSTLTSELVMLTPDDQAGYLGWQKRKEFQRYYFYKVKQFSMTFQYLYGALNIFN